MAESNSSLMGLNLNNIYNYDSVIEYLYILVRIKCRIRFQIITTLKVNMTGCMRLFRIVVKIKLMIAF